MDAIPILSILLLMYYILRRLLRKVKIWAESFLQWDIWVQGLKDQHIGTIQVGVKFQLHCFLTV